jgi:hypothetical protein
MKCKEEERHGRVKLNVDEVTTLHHTLWIWPESLLLA